VEHRLPDSDEPFAPDASWLNTPPEPEPSAARKVLLLTLIGVLLAAGCGGSVLVMRALDETAPPVADRRGDAGPGDRAGDPSGRASASDEAKASSYPVGSADDLERVCDRWYYPQSPAYAGAAPHPIAVGVKDRRDLDSRIIRSVQDLPGRSAAAKAAWNPPDPAAVQLVACLDLVDAGQPIRTCAFDDPKPETLPLNEGIYALNVYEVATRKKVAEARLTGENQKCPSIVLLGRDKTVYSEVTDRQLVEALSRHVES
jgi:hypothetical protein